MLPLKDPRCLKERTVSIASAGLFQHNSTKWLFSLAERQQTNPPAAGLPLLAKFPPCTAKEENKRSGSIQELWKAVVPELNTRQQPLLAAIRSLVT